MLKQLPKNPFASLISQIEAKLQEHPHYLTTSWEEVKRSFLLHLLGLEHNGSKINRLAHSAPNEAITCLILDTYEDLNHKTYFTSQFWRSFYFWLDRSVINKERWPLFGETEIYLSLSLLRPDEIAVLKKEAESQWANFFDDQTAVDALFRKVQGPITNLCRRRLNYLTRKDPALYSLPDLVQQVNYEVSHTLRNNDHFADAPSKMYRWTLKCADNIILNIKNQAQALKRGLDSEYLELDGVDEWEMPNIEILGTLEDRLCLDEMIKKANPKIQTYLTILFKEHHSPDFWEWFYRAEPELACKTVYTEEHPEVLSPWVQRWLDLPTHELVGFLKNTVPSFMPRRGLASY